MDVELWLKLNQFVSVLESCKHRWSFCRFNALFIYWNVFVWENLKNWRISPAPGWLLISNSRLAGFAIVSSTYTRIRRDMFANVSIWIILALRSLQAVLDDLLFVMFPFQKTPEGQRPKAKEKEKQWKKAGFVRHLCVRLLSPTPECGNLGRQINLGGDFMPPLISAFLSDAVNCH